MSHNSNFLTEDFLLHSEAAKKLFHEYAEDMPIFDYHCHLNPKDLAENRQYNNLYEIWLEGDHYKWRAMRTSGISEEYITGNKSPREKFQKWAETVPKTIGNPLYHWTHLELRRPFGITDLHLNADTAEDVWTRTEKLLAQPEFSSWGILKKMNVKMVGTTDDPIDDLKYHEQLNSNKDAEFKMYPTFRPDKAMGVHSVEGFNEYLDTLGSVCNTTIDSWKSLLSALADRHQYFHDRGCRVTDHALDKVFYIEATDSELEAIFTKIRSGKALSEQEQGAYITAFMLEMGRLNSSKGWVMQIHIGALRNNNSRMVRTLGADTGFDSIQDGMVAPPLAKLLDSLDTSDQLPKTILYTLNPANNEIFATMLGNFQGAGVKGKLQFGSGWWFNDQKTGMQDQMTSLANLGLLSAFVGMVTDSRSLLSYPRHEYFRRVLCNLIGGWVDAGEAPADYELLGNMVKDICFRNCIDYFPVEL